MYAIPLKQFYNDSIKAVASKHSLSRYHVPHSKNVSLFCTSPLSDQFLRLAVAVKNKVYMLAYKHAATMVLYGSPVTPISSTDPKDNFIKHRVSSFFLFHLPAPFLFSLLPIFFLPALPSLSSSPFPSSPSHSIHPTSPLLPLLSCNLIHYFTPYLTTGAGAI